MRYLTLLLFSLGSSVLLFGQDIPQITFGQVSDADRSLVTVPGDSTAEAYVLYDRLSLDFEYDEMSGPSLVERYHHRIKLLRPASFSRANVELEYDKKYGKISGVEAYVHLPTGGTIRVSPDDIIEDNGSGTDRTVKFTFPRVSEGAIIEYRYTHRRTYIAMPTPKVFQQDIPVRYAQYDAIIPPYYGYVRFGHANLDVDEVEIITRQWGPTFGTAAAYKTGDSDIEHTHLVCGMHDLPAFRPQPYSNNVRDYMPRIQLQLQQVHYPGQPVQYIFEDWENTAENLYNRDDFGRYYRKKGNYRQVFEDFEPELATLNGTADILNAAYLFVTRNFGWNGIYTCLGSDSPNRIYENGTGNSADLNIALLSLLNEAGIEAYPVLVSLRNTGAPIEQYPIMDQFNHLMVYVEVDGVPHFLDANGSDRPLGLPRESALNHRGWVVDPDNPRWVTIDVPSSRQTVLVEMEVTEDGSAHTKMTGRLENYYAFNGRGILAEGKGDQHAPLISDVVRQLPQTQITSLEVDNDVKERPNRIDLTADMVVPAGQALDDYIYLQPVLINLLDGELADADLRYLPIDFPFPWEQRYMASIRLPEDFTLEESPDRVRLRSEDGSITAAYAVEERAPGYLSVTLTVKLDRTLYTAEEYPVLRDMFRRIIELQESPLVCKRISK